MSEFRIVVLRDRVTVVHGAHIPEVQVRLLVPQWRTMMGLFDTVELYDDVHLPEYPEGITPAEDVDWQTKGIDRPSMTTFRVTADGRLLEEEWHTEAVPPEDRPYVSRDDVEEGELLYMAGCRNQVHDGWVDRNDYHGRFNIKHTFENLDTICHVSSDVHAWTTRRLRTPAVTRACPPHLSA